MIKEYLKKAAKTVRIPAAIGILLWPVTAMADPGSALLLLGSALVKIGSVYLGYALIAGTIIYGTIDARRRARNAAENAKNQRNFNLKDRSQTVLDQLPPWTIRYGRTLAGTTVHAVFTTDKTGVRKNGDTFVKKDAYKHIVYVHAAHECAAINGYKINGIEVGELDDNGWALNPVFKLPEDYGYSAVKTVEIGPSASYVSPYPVVILKAYDKAQSATSAGTPLNIAYYFGQLSNQTVNLSGDRKTLTNPSATITIVVTFTYVNAASTLRISSHLGSPSQTVDTYLNGLIPDKWTSNHRLRGRCYSVVTVDLENVDFQGGIPQFEADISGRLLYDPRSATTAYGNNWALVVRDYLTAIWGAGADSTDIDDTYTNSAANASDVAVPVSIRSYSDSTVWSFASGVDSFTGVNGTVAASGGLLTFTGTSMVNPGAIQRTGLSINGGANRYIRARIRRTGGVTWDGRLQYSTAGHGISNDYYGLQIVGMKIGGDWQEVVWDMHNLRVGGSDWKNSTITGLVMVFSLKGADEVFQVDWIAASSETTVTQNQGKYTVNAVITTDQDRSQVLNELVAAGAGIVHQSGEWAIVAGAWSSPVMDLTDNDLVGQIQLIQADAGLEELINSVRGTYFESGSSQSKDMDPYVNATLVTEDGENLWQDIAFPFTDNEQRCQNLARIAVERSRNGQIIQYPASLKAFPIRVGDRVRVTNTEFGFSLKEYFVTDWDFGQTSPVVLSLQEDTASIWDLADQVVYDPTPNTSLKDPRYVRAFLASEITVESGTLHLVKQSDGAIVPRVYIAWPLSAEPYLDGSNATVEIIWQRVMRDDVNSWRRVEVPIQQGNTYLLGAISSDSLIIGIRAKNSLGFASEYVYLTHDVVGETQAASDVSGFSATPFAGSILYTWTRCPDVDYGETELRVGASWAAGVAIFKGAADRFSYQQSTPVNVTVFAKHRDTTGNESANAVSASAISLSLNDTRNYDFTNGLDGWTNVTSLGTGSSSASGGNYGITASAGYIYPSSVPVDVARRYRVTVRLYASGADITGVYAGAAGFDQSGAMIVNSGGASHPWCAAVSVTIPNDSKWHVYTGEIVGAFTVPSGSAPYNRFWTGTVKASPIIHVPAGTGGANLFIDYGTLDDITDVAVLGASLIVASNNCQVNGGRITKISGGNAWNADAYSKNGYKGGAAARVEMTTGMAAAGPVFVFGLNDSPVTANFTDINFGIYVDGANVSIVEEGTTVALNITTAADGDVFEVTYDGTRARYYKNGAELKATLSVVTGSLYFDCSIWREGTYIDKASFGPMTSNAWGEVGGTAKPSDYASADLTMVNDGNCVQSGNRVTKVADVNGWNAGAHTKNGYVGGAYISCVITTGMTASLPVFMFGLNDANSTPSYTDINFAFAIGVNGATQVDIYEEGTITNTAITTFADGDHFEITYDGFTARYYKNGALLETTVVISASSFYGDCSIWRTNTYIDRISFGPMSKMAGIVKEQITSVSSLSVTGKFDAVNIIGSAGSGTVGSTALTVSSGAVLNQYVYNILGDFVFEDPPSSDAAPSISIIQGYVEITLNSSFTGGGLDYSLEVSLYPAFKMRMGSGGTYASPELGQRFFDKRPITLTGSETIRIPFSMVHPLTGAVNVWDRVLTGVYVDSIKFVQLAVNGGAAKTDCLNLANIQYEGMIRQFPN